MADLRLIVNGTAYGGWKEIRVRRSLEEIAGQFTLGVSDRWAQQHAPIAIRTGDRASVAIDGQSVITGFIDTVQADIDDRQHAISVVGRDATGDLVDCAAMHRKGEWRQATLAQIARDLAAPFGITVKVDADIGAPFASWALQEGESAYACLERAARQRGVLLLSDGTGGLILGQVRTVRVATALVLGENLLHASTRNDASQRFATYVLKGQRAGDDEVSGEDTRGLKATATDPGITRPRTRVIVCEDEGDLASLQRRAKWEATVCAARGLTVSASVNGWRHAGGLWSPNVLASFIAPRLNLERELLIRDVELILDARGERTELTLTPREAYQLHAMPAGRRRDQTQDLLS